MPDNDNDLPLCPNCLGERFVCENHPRLAWPSECDCGAGMPCPVCNLSPGRPQLPDDFEIDVEVFDRPPNGKPHH